MRLQYDARGTRRVEAASQFGRVAVLLGGTSSEREVSLLSGKAVLAGLERRGLDVIGFDPAERALTDLLTLKIDRVWIALHGPGGEDGTVQGALEFLGIPYSGSGVMGSAIGMDKLRTKRLCQAVGVPTSPFVVLREAQDLDTAVETLGLPVFVKPGSQGSSVGMARVERAEDLKSGLGAGAALRPGRICGKPDSGRRVHRGDTAVKGAAIDPYRNAADFLRLRSQVSAQ